MVDTHLRLSSEPWKREELEAVIKKGLKAIGRADKPSTITKPADLDKTGCNWEVKFVDPKVDRAMAEQGAT